MTASGSVSSGSPFVRSWMIGKWFHVIASHPALTGADKAVASAILVDGNFDRYRSTFLGSKLRLALLAGVSLRSAVYALAKLERLGLISRPAGRRGDVGMIRVCWSVVLGLVGEFREASRRLVSDLRVWSRGSLLRQKEACSQSSLFALHRQEREAENRLFNLELQISGSATQGMRKGLRSIKTSSLVAVGSELLVSASGSGNGKPASWSSWRPKR